ncbi:MAG: hypothetical protein ACLR9W_02205 [Enterobacter hormaechei]
MRQRTALAYSAPHLPADDRVAKSIQADIAAKERAYASSSSAPPCCQLKSRKVFPPPRVSA